MRTRSHSKIREWWFASALQLYCDVGMTVVSNAWGNRVMVFFNYSYSIVCRDKSEENGENGKFSSWYCNDDFQLRGDCSVDLASKRNNKASGSWLYRVQRAGRWSRLECWGLPHRFKVDQWLQKCWHVASVDCVSSDIYRDTLLTDSEKTCSLMKACASSRIYADDIIWKWMLQGVRSFCVSGVFEIVWWASLTGCQRREKRWQT